jgi:hypothetical protein
LGLTRLDLLVIPDANPHTAEDEHATEYDDRRSEDCIVHRFEHGRARQWEMTIEVLLLTYYEQLKDESVVLDDSSPVTLGSVRL